MADHSLIENAERLGQSLVPIAEAHTSGRVNRQLVKALGSAGMFETLFAARVTATSLCQIRQGLARVCTEAETALAVQGLGGFPISRYGNDEIRRQWVPLLRSGDAVAAFALTEPEAGSDAAALELRAEVDGDGYRLTGVKTYISNAPDADVATVFARTTADAGARGVTAFAVPIDSEGIEGEPIDMIASHALGRWSFDAVFVPAANMLGAVDHGFGVAMETLDLYRPSVGAFALGMAEAALGLAVEHAKSRTAFGTQISRFQGISHQLADVKTEIEATRHLVYDAAATHDGGGAITGKAAMAKLYATETAQHAVDVAIQTLGARGLEADSTLSHLYREVRATRIYEGTSEIQRNIIAREMFGDRL